MPGEQTNSFQHNQLLEKNNYTNGNASPTTLGNDSPFSINIPSVSLPKGGGAIKGVDEKFETNAVNGSASLSIPLPLASARGFGSSLAIAYNSGIGNGIFGMGWSLNLSSILRKTQKELPQYLDESDSDTYIFSGGEDLVVRLKESAGAWSPDEDNSPDDLFRIKRYRPRIEDSFARVERWTRKSDGMLHWRVISKENITSLFGDTPLTRIADPADAGRIFEWLPHFSYDDKGNCILYEYKHEDGIGMDESRVHNRNRTTGNALFTNTYLKRVRSGNINPYMHGDPIPPSAQFLFETVLDYGEHDKDNEPFNEIQPWQFRADAFSDYRSGFEVRNCRLCERVLQYHHFPELPGGSALVSSLDLKYDDNGQIGNFSFLKEIASFGYIKHIDHSYTKKSLPPLAFAYQQHTWNMEIKISDASAMLHAPAGINEPSYQWVDLYSEGLNGMLTEQANDLYYKQNLGNGNFSAAKPITPQPSFSGLGMELQLQELEADGTKYLAGYSGNTKGFFRLNDQGEWQPFQPFEQTPNVDLSDRNTRLIDLDGDGRAEILVTEDNVFTWYPSLGEKGFDSSRKVWQRLDEETGPHIVFNDAGQSIYLCDMNGDGLADIVRIQNGSVCYWPNLGYGKFGAKVHMDNAPVFDHPDTFNATYIKLADIDGSGTTDIIYLGKQKCSIWLNQNGNGFRQQPEEIYPFPEISGLSQVAVLDFLGNGTACIVWSSPQPKDSNQPLRYIDLMDGRKPHLLKAYRNNMGKEVELEYTPSTYFFLQDKLKGAPWITQLPFPIHCLSKVITYDRIIKTRFASEYSYHHGYYDHAEREFRGFGRTEQKDAEDITHFIRESGGAMNNIVQQDLHQPPVLVKTWFHTGAFLDGEKILNQFAHEYSQNNIYPENLLPEPVLPAGLSIDEYRQALRACKGMMLRKEVYALDDSPLSDKPYTVEQQNCTVRLVQPQLDNKHASFLTVGGETISYHYERELNDPRIAHSFVLEVDEFANIKKSAALVYGRKNPVFPEQNIIYTTYTENNFTNAIDSVSDHRTPALFETKLYEITGLPASTGEYYTLPEIKNACIAAAPIDYDTVPNGANQKRIIEWSRLCFRDDNGAGIMPFGTLPSKALLHQTFKAAFNQNQLVDVFNAKISLADMNTALIDPLKGGYIFADNYYWAPSVIAAYDITHFFLTTSFTDAFGNASKIGYDSNYYLFIERSTDPYGNEIQVKKFNYRVLNACLMQDINDNLTAVRFDELGIVNKTFIIGKKGTDPGDGFDDTMVEASPNDFPSSELEYHVFEWFDQSTDPAFDINNYKPRPNFIQTKTRDTHFHAHPLHETAIRESYAYFSGGGQEALIKAHAEPGEALQVNPDGSVTTVNTSGELRWVGNGRTILNNKGNPVKQYEPYFSVTPAFEDEKEMVELGVSPIIQYDPAGRAIRTDYPNKTFSKVSFTAWEQKTFDPNDTVAESKWYDLRILHPDPAIATPEEVSAAEKAFLHNNTPTGAYLDTLGRTFFTEADNVTEKIGSHVSLDIRGKASGITDAAGRKVMQSEYDLLGRSLRQTSMDAGTRWTLPDAGNSPLLSWDERDHAFGFEYDKLRRPVSSSVKTGDNTPLVFGRVEYGESLPLSVAKADNLLGLAYRNYDQSGIVTTNRNDFKGNLLSGSRQLVAGYKNTIDWTSIPDVLLDSDVFTSMTEYDALNRPVKITTPHSPAMSPSEIYPGYNEAGMLEKVDVRIRGASTISPFVVNISYDAKGQREEILYANGSKTKYAYDKDSFRLINLKTTRNPGPTVLQDLKYTYDPAGNITSIKDYAHSAIFFDGEQVQPFNEYEYDAIYRLIKASGRKHAGQTDIQPKTTLTNRSFRNHPFIANSGINPNDAASFRNYTETYLYDKTGNMKEQKHISKNSSWTRSFEYDNNNNLNNRLTKTSVGNDDYNYTYDAHGNMYGLETVQNEVWNFMDHFKEAGLGGGGTAFYVYDTGAQRVRKVIERQNGNIQERIYLGGVEIYRERNGAGNIVLERETLHVMDDQKRIAMVDTPVIQSQGSNETQLIRYQYDNHLGSASLELDDQAKVISYEEYFPYGASSYSTIDAAREAPAKRYRYTGKERDEESGLNYHGARYYAPWLSRWTTSDPAGLKDGLNVYLYVNNNPVMSFDPTGTEGLNLSNEGKYRHVEVKQGGLEELAQDNCTSASYTNDNNTYTCISYKETPPVTIAKSKPEPKPKPAAKPKPKPKEEEKKGRELSASELYDIVMALQPRLVYPKPVRQFFGGVKMVGGGLTAAGGYTFAFFTAETGVGLVGGIVVGSYGLDVASSGFTTMMTGEDSKTYTFMIGAGYTSMVTDDPGLINAGGQSLETLADIGSAAFTLKVSGMPVNIGESGPIARNSLFVFRSPGKEPYPFLNLTDDEIDLALSSMGSEHHFRIPVSATEGGTPLESLAPVSRWGRPGLQPGDWVMPGPPTRFNYVLSFKWDPISPTNIVAPYSAGQAYMVPANSVVWPKGWGLDGWWKGLYGQRIYSPQVTTNF